MMLPSSLPLLRLFAAAAAGQPRSRAAIAVFLGGYALVWTSFGWLAFAGDTMIHATVDRTPWLQHHEWLIAGGALGLAGAFQFSSLKDRCLEVCRHPGAFLLRHYERGLPAAFSLGRRHGLFCLGCCWALMLYEKTGERAWRAVPMAGIALLACAALVLAHPHWLPPILGGNH